MIAEVLLFVFHPSFFILYYEQSSDHRAIRAARINFFNRFTDFSAAISADNLAFRRYCRRYADRRIV
jgi:hypothetical protein